VTPYPRIRPFWKTPNTSYTSTGDNTRPTTERFIRNPSSLPSTPQKNGASSLAIRLPRKYPAWLSSLFAFPGFDVVPVAQLLTDATGGRTLAWK
jgi:hypothetical protein